RLMFVTFLQRHGLLRNRMGRWPGSLSARALWRRLLPGAVSGSLFGAHELEGAYPEIGFPGEALTNVFSFFDRFRWRLGGPPASADEVTPDVLGQVFEQHAGAKAAGAYYTAGDVTGYIAAYTILPFLLGAVARECPGAFAPGGHAWLLLREQPDRYLHEAVRRGTDLPLPPDVRVGLREVGRRSRWNDPAPPPYALPAETWREHVARRRRCHGLRRRLRAGRACAVNDLVTLNLDVRRFADDLPRTRAGPCLLRVFWQQLRALSVLDPTCGAGAFLLAAAGVLEPLYAACLDRMQAVLDEGRAEHAEDFRAVLGVAQNHP